LSNKSRRKTMSEEGMRRFEEEVDRWSCPEKQESLKEVLGHLQELLPDRRRLYWKYPIVKEEGYSIVLTLWAPGAATRPHSHSGSEARIRVLNGSLWQRNFSIEKVGGMSLGGNLYREGENITEERASIHRIANAVSNAWAASLHLFSPPLEGMEVYDFDRNRGWSVTGDENTLGEPPSHALPIWPDFVPGLEPWGHGTTYAHGL
jgi:hypothetical protein